MKIHARVHPGVGLASSFRVALTRRGFWRFEMALGDLGDEGKWLVFITLKGMYVRHGARSGASVFVHRRVCHVCGPLAPGIEPFLTLLAAVVRRLSRKGMEVGHESRSGHRFFVHRRLAPWTELSSVCVQPRAKAVVLSGIVHDVIIIITIIFCVFQFCPSTGPHNLKGVTVQL